jgi:hypothetical protein
MEFLKFMPFGVYIASKCTEIVIDQHARVDFLNFLFLEKKTPLTIAVIKSKQLTYLHNKYERYSQIIVMIKRFDIQ